MSNDLVGRKKSGHNWFPFTFTGILTIILIWPL